MLTFIEKRTVHQTLACFPVLFNQFLVGLGWGWIAPTLVKLRGTNFSPQMTELEISWILSVHEIGRTGGPIISPFIVDYFGRRNTVILLSILNVLIWVSHAFTHNVYLLCLIRMVFGATNGLQDVVSPVYTTENCSPDYRKVVASLVSIVFTVGKLVEILLATYLDYETTVMVNIFFSICSFGPLYFCVETPQYLIMKQKHAQAEKNLKWLKAHTKSSDLSNELNHLKKYVDKEREKRKSIKTLLSDTENMKAISIVLLMYLFSTATGGIAIGAYASMVFPSTEILNWSHFVTLAEIENFMTLLIAPIINAKFDPRKVLISCYSLVVLAHFLTSALFYLHQKNYDVKFYPWILFLTLSSYGVVRSITGPAQYVIKGEGLPLSVRALGGSMSVMITAATGFSILKAFLPITDYFGIEMNFVLFASMSALTVLLIYFYLPSTRNESSGDEKTENKSSV